MTRLSHIDKHTRGISQKLTTWHQSQGVFCSFGQEFLKIGGAETEFTAYMVKGSSNRLGWSGQSSLTKIPSWPVPWESEHQGTIQTQLTLLWEANRRSDSHRKPARKARPCHFRSE